MSYSVIEQTVRGKSAAQPCQDSIVTTLDYCAVIDGSTAKTDRTYDGMAPGLLAARLVAESVRALPSKATLEEATSLLTSAIRSYYLSHGLLDRVARHPEERITASVVIYSDSRREIWWIGDCQCRVDGRTLHPVKRIDEVLSRIRAEADRYLLSHGYTVDQLRRKDLGRQIIMGALRDQCGFQNVLPACCPYAYPVIDGFEVMRSSSLDSADGQGGWSSIAVAPDIHQLVLASDGYPYLADTLAASERQLEDLLRQDPLLIRDCSSTKGLAVGADSYDDRAYLRISI